MAKTSLNDYNNEIHCVYRYSFSQKQLLTRFFCCCCFCLEFWFVSSIQRKIHFKFANEQTNSTIPSFDLTWEMISQIGTLCRNAMRGNVENLGDGRQGETDRQMEECLTDRKRENRQRGRQVFFSKGWSLFSAGFYRSNTTVAKLWNKHALAQRPRQNRHRHRMIFSRKL